MIFRPKERPKKVEYKKSADGKVCLVTGAAGFIGFHLSKRLLEQGEIVCGIDNLNDYYDVRLKHARLSQLYTYKNFTFLKGDIADRRFIRKAYMGAKPDTVVHLAAQAGVRYSLENPDAYIKSNIVGFYNLLETARRRPPRHLLYASSSSVYGANTKVPFKESDRTGDPLSLYAATKMSNEIMAGTYSRLHKIPMTGLRFFTVYGPMGRPDMAYYKFTQRFFAGAPIRVYNNGDLAHDLYRDYTYIDDIVEGIQRIMESPPGGDAPHRIFNIGNNRPEKLSDLIATLERSLSRAVGREVKFNKVYEGMKPGDMRVTCASTEALKEAVGFAPKTTIEDGLQKFADWYVDWYKQK